MIKIQSGSSFRKISSRKIFPTNRSYQRNGYLETDYQEIFTFWLFWLMTTKVSHVKVLKNLI